MAIEPFEIDIVENGVKFDGQFEELRDILEWLEWWFYHLPWKEIPDGSKIVTNVIMPKSKELEAC